MSSISLKNVKKAYGDDVVIENLNLEIKDGSFTVLVGPSGCGKSTTLRMIAGLEDISEGELFIDEKYMNNVQPKDRDIAMVFQSYALYPQLNVYDNINKQPNRIKCALLPEEAIDKMLGGLENEK